MDTTADELRTAGEGLELALRAVAQAREEFKDVARGLVNRQAPRSPSAHTRPMMAAIHLLAAQQLLGLDFAVETSGPIRVLFPLPRPLRLQAGGCDHLLDTAREGRQRVLGASGAP